MSTLSLIERLMSRTERTEGCWLWRGPVDKSGYGTFTVRRRGQRLSTVAHRLVYAELVGAIPDGMEIDHLCHGRDRLCAGGAACMHRRCVNPAHLEPVPKLVNMLRGLGPTAVNARKTHCIHGHPLTPDNVYIIDGKDRHCRTCSIRRAAEHTARNRERFNARRRELRALRRAERERAEYYQLTIGAQP